MAKTEKKRRQEQGKNGHALKKKKTSTPSKKWASVLTSLSKAFFNLFSKEVFLLPFFILVRQKFCL
jgi:hypothetical protein